jgi:hypothetical protein
LFNNSLSWLFNRVKFFDLIHEISRRAIDLLISILLFDFFRGLFLFLHDLSLFIGGLSSLDVSKHVSNFIIASNLSDGTSLADVIAALVTPVEHVMLVQIEAFTNITAWLISNLALDSGQSVVTWAANSIFLLLNLFINKGTSLWHIALHFKF